LRWAGLIGAAAAACSVTAASAVLASWTRPAAKAAKSAGSKTPTNIYPGEDFIQVAIYRLLQDHPKLGHLPLAANKMYAHGLHSKF
jgi:hypothetical protein